MLLLKKHSPTEWEVLVGGSGMNVGRGFTMAAGLEGKVLEVLDGSNRMVRFSEPIDPHLEEIGQVPLPPYIHTTLSDPERYQTVYAHVPGSAAAPTAGLHFTPELFEKLRSKGVEIAFVNLQVGLDTFAPVTEDRADEHKIHTEWCSVPRETTDKINQTKKAGNRVIAVGTTTVRTLESAASRTNPDQVIAAFEGPTSLFILPGYSFKVVDGIITNFHLPKSTLLMLVSAFAGREAILAAYQEAVRLRYRFFSFGDAMLLI
jgi:S-adenosylmethionine:tRNA ribosyltransferase-isomerase